jgi:Family of unknown function (DUF5519)
MKDELLAEIEHEVLSWPGVFKASSEGGTGRGGHRVPPFTSFRLGRREIGHIHANGIADLTFTREIHDKLIADGRATPHGAGFPGVVSYRVRSAEDVPGAIELFRTNYDRLRGL